MVFLAKDNEHHTVLVQHMTYRSLRLLSNQFYSKLSLQPKHNHSNIVFLNNKPKTLNNFSIKTQAKFKLQNRLNYVNQNWIQQYK